MASEIVRRPPGSLNRYGVSENLWNSPNGNEGAGQHKIRNKWPSPTPQEFCNSFLKWLPGLGSNLGAILITNDLSSVNGCFNADCLTNSMHADEVIACWHLTVPAPLIDPNAEAEVLTWKIMCYTQ
jgi:hypothetical protein